MVSTCVLSNKVPKVQKVTYQSTFEANSDDRFIEIVALSISEEKVLDLKVNYKGGCKNDHELNCFYSAEHNTSTDTVKLFLTHISDDKCFSIINDSAQFQLTDKMLKPSHNYLKVNDYHIEL